MGISGLSLLYHKGTHAPVCFWRTAFRWKKFRTGSVTATFPPRLILMHTWITLQNLLPLTQCLTDSESTNSEQFSPKSALFWRELLYNNGTDSKNQEISRQKCWNCKEKVGSFWNCRQILAEREGFEPSWDCSQTDFESAPLWPLRYRCMGLLCHRFPLVASRKKRIE